MNRNSNSNKNHPRIIFMGTPEFALPVLQALCGRYNVVCAVTKPDTPKGRGHKMAPPPVKEFCIAHDIPVLQPVKVRTDDFPEALASFEPDLFVTCAYGRILTQKVLDVPPMGTVNVHASILPKYRGAAPLWWQVINGEEEVGVTTMLTDIGMDTGGILMTGRMPLDPDATMGEVHDALSEMGAELIIQTIDGMLKGDILPTPQDNEAATYAPMVSKEDAEISWDAPAGKIHNLVRGMNPYPTAWTTMDGETLKVFRAAAAEDRPEDAEALPGTVTDVKSGIRVKAGEGSVIIEELQAAGAKRMDWKAYLNGHKIEIGTVLGV